MKVYLDPDMTNKKRREEYLKHFKDYKTIHGEYSEKTLKKFKEYLKEAEEKR
ncbi:MAG: hypothetical protein IK121_07730 [Lachnospiraceae bacterium]|nr:hypothetical protein [Lachnospiraceae bacterium]